MMSTRRAFIDFRMMVGRVLHRCWLRARPIRMKITTASSQLGERLGIDWLTYNPLVFLFYHEYAVADAPTVARTFEKVFPEAGRFVDAGAGSGAYAAELRRRGHMVVAYEYARLGRFIARLQGVHARPFDLAQPVVVEPTEFDLAYSFEVAEHLPPELGDRLVAFLAASAPTVVFTAAPPGQGGTGHINEQERPYWVVRFRNHGMVERQELRDRVAAGFRDIRSSWLATNVMVFTREGL
jgi:SAM-dependent methyltransferase